MKCHRQLCSFLFALIYLLLFTSCTKEEKLRVGLNAWPGYELLYLMDHKGFDKEAGVDTEILFFNSLADARRSFERGELDLLGTTVVETLMIQNNSERRPKIFYVSDYSNGGDLIISTKKFPSIESLRGKKVGVEIGSVCIYTLYLALKKHGMTLSDVIVMEADQDSISKGLKEGRFAAGVTYSPFSIMFAGKNDFHVLFSTKESPNQIIDVLIAPGEVFEKRKNDYKKLVGAFERARLYAEKEGSDGFEIMAKRENITVEEFKRAYSEDMRILSIADQKDFFQKGLLIDVIEESLKAIKIFDKREFKKFSAKEIVGEGLFDQ